MLPVLNTLSVAYRGALPVRSTMHPLCWAVCGRGNTSETLTVWVSNWVACRWCGVILLPVVPGATVLSQAAMCPAGVVVLC